MGETTGSASVDSLSAQQQPQLGVGGAPVSAREVTLGKTIQSGSVGPNDPRLGFEQTYQLGKELGHGSFSTVREGTHKVGWVIWREGWEGRGRGGGVARLRRTFVEA